MSRPNEVLCRRWLEEVWNQGKESAIDELFSESAVEHNISGRDIDLHGPEQFKMFIGAMRLAFPDIQVVANDIVVDGDRAALRFTASATHKGDFMGLTASGKRVELQGMAFVRIENGKIVEGWNLWDQMGLMLQLEAVPVASVPRVENVVKS